MLLGILQCYSLAVIGYGVATFNNCEKAAAELKLVTMFSYSFLFFPSNPHIAVQG